MVPAPSFVTANFVARPIGYRMTKGWPEGDDASNAWFAPWPTFTERFDEMLTEIRALGFSAIDLWCAHLHWRWATVRHIASARALLVKHGLAVHSYPAWVMGGADELRVACRLCAELSIPFFAGNCELFTNDRASAVAILREYGVGYAIENHPEKSSSEIFGRLGAGDHDVVGVALDTGWCATRGWDSLAATKDFRGRLFAVHLKDVRAPRLEKSGLEFVDLGHETCRLGDGIARVRDVLRELQVQKFLGSIGIEHEPETFDPSRDVRESRERVEQWWAAP
jgi:sugar phosphate isomerase/epimerase